ncbi:SusC/RagA family TonB-linked outer membrane protein [Reichenbachiella sp. MSK19-1]|uniref:SusC/RagA family TonB-linked outer membrane protein n=1 Tax=Reichenbachiella sp. MSK19-1 TaxID=1897631 RepID=UPI000E6BCABA|nr:SusC/RagA family TonB-linked outer membrane protein [Reichenbachiella sp. MSK19-1]RJE74509.1 SusC/RagA family protein [Reichenbachiella sp. MSK19-1]
MNYIKIAMVLCAVWGFFPALLQAQNTMNTELTASIVPIRAQSGVDIDLYKDNNGEADKLIASADTVANKEVVLLPGSDGYPVEVAFRQVGEKDLSHDVSFVDMPSILDKNYIINPLDNMEAFVGGFNGNLWGQTDYLTLIDGVPRDIGSVLPTEVAQVTFLKGVSAVALYGSMGARGVVLITTKRGKIHGQEITVRTNAGVHVPKAYPRYLGSAEYMDLFNEARVNDGLDELYSQEQIYYSAQGTDPYRYPDVDYYSTDYVQKAYSRYDATVEIEGGNEKTQYYTNMGFYRTGTPLNFGGATENHDKRFNIRGNVDMNIANWLTAKVDAAVVFYNGIGSNTDYWGAADTLTPNRYTPLVPIDRIEANDQASLDLVGASQNIINGQYLLGGTQLQQSTPIGAIYAGGTNNYNSRQFQFNAGANADLGAVVQGLSLSTTFGVDYNSTYNVAFNNEYAVYQPSWTSYAGDNRIASLTKYGNDASSGSQDITDSWYTQTLSFNAHLDYQRTFDNRHNFSGMLLAYGFQRSISALYHKPSNANLGLHLGYNFKHKYYVDFDGALVHSAKLPEDNRQSISPTATLGWRLSEEAFLKDVSFLSNLKLSVSGGILNTDLDIQNVNNEDDASDYYLYQQVYNQTDGAWVTWKDGFSNQSTDSRRGSNPNLDYPQRRELSLGLDFALFDNAIVFEGSFFASQTSGIAVQNNVLFPSYFVSNGYPSGSFVPYTNYNNDDRMGVDFNLRLNQNVGELALSLGVSGIYYTTEASQRAEMYEDAYQNRQGQPLDAIWGLENLGFFADATDIQNSPDQIALGEVQPGDLKYKDQNNDGIINAQDEVYLGRAGWSGAPLTMGFNLTANYKNFTFFALGTYRSGAYGMKNNNYFWVNGQDKYSEEVRGRWTEDTQNSATFPRLTTLNGANNFRNSDFWMYSTDRFDLSRVQISYDFPESLLGGPDSFIRELGIYVNGANLLTISPNREILEMNIGSAPQTRFYNLGLRAMF